MQCSGVYAPFKIVSLNDKFIFGKFDVSSNLILINRVLILIFEKSN